MTGIVLSHSTVPHNALFANSTPQQSSKKKIVEIVAFVALALVAAAMAAIAGLVLSGIVASVIAASATALLMGVGAVVYKVLDVKKGSNAIPIPSPLRPQSSPIVSVEPSIAPIVKTAPTPTPEWTIAKLKDRVAKNQQILEERIKKEKGLPATSIASLEPFPKLCDLDKYTPPFSLDFPIQKFSDGDMSKKMNALTSLMRQHHPKEKNLINSATEYLSFEFTSLLNSHSNVYGWRRYAAVLLYQNWKEIFKGEIDPPPGDDLYKTMQGFDAQGKRFCLKLVQRVEWLAEIFTKENLPFDPQLCLEFLGTDIDFLNEIDFYFTSLGQALCVLTNKDPHHFNLYRDEQKMELKKKDDWPHRLQLLKEIEKYGFEFTPTLIKRDCCKCKKCGEEISGWRSWMGSTDLYKHSPVPVAPLLGSIEQARGVFLNTLGCIDEHYFSPLNEDGPNVHVVHRSNGNIAVVTEGLWNPNDPSLPGMEFLVELPKTTQVLEKHPLLQALVEISKQAKKHSTTFLHLMKTRGFCTMEVNVAGLPPHHYYEHTKKTVCMFIGFDASALKTCPVPKFFKGPNNEEVPIYTARLLTLSEWTDSQDNRLGKAKLAERFKADGTNHISKIT